MMKSLIKKYREIPLTVKCALCFTCVNFLQRGITVIITPIMTRLMSTAEYSMYSVYTAWADILVIFATLYLFRDAIDSAILQCETDYERERVVSSFQGLSFTIAVGFFIVYFLFSRQIDRIIGLPHYIVVLMFLSFVFYAPLNLWTVLKRYKLEYKEPVAVTAFTSLFVPIVSLIVITNTSYKGEARIIVYALTTIGVGIGIFITNLKKTKVFFDRKLWKFAFTFNIVLIPHFLSEIVLNHSDRIMINNLVGASETAIYAIAYSVSQLVLLFTQAINMAFVPWQYQKIKAGERKSLAEISNIVLILVSAILIVMICFAPEAICILAGSQYMDAVDLIPVISLGIYFSFLYQFFTRVEVYYQKKENMAIASILAAILNLGLNFVCIKLFGYKAAGYTTLVCYVFLCVLHFLFYRKICKETIDGKNYFDLKAIVAISIVMTCISFVMMLIYTNTVLRYAVILTIIAILAMNYKKILSVFLKMKGEK